MNTCLKKFLSFLLCIFVLIPSSGCASETGRADEEDKPKKSKTQKADVKDSDYERLVICGFELPDDDYYIKRKSGTDYLMIELEAFKSAFKIPYIPNQYPELEGYKDGKISIVWKNREDIILKVDLEEGSSMVVINGSEYDMGIAPVLRSDALFIPSNIFIELLEMKEKYNRKLDYLIIDRKEDFPKDILLGTWSDIETNLFVGFKEITTGRVELPSFAESYEFNEDGTYRLIMASTGGYKDAFLYLEGRYVIHGNTIACYDIIETLYEGQPMQLVHKNKRLDYPHFEYIGNYDPNEDKIEQDL